jgi:hypothetical protein
MSAPLQKLPGPFPDGHQALSAMISSGTLAALDAHGFTAIPGAVDANVVEQVRRQLQAEYSAAMPLPWRGGGRWFGHVNYLPSPRSPLIAALATQPAIKAILDALLGPDYRVVRLVGNANLPGSVYQPEHADGDMDRTFVIVNVPLGPVDEDNGSTAVWPGTHRSMLSHRQFHEQYSLRREQRINTAAGDVVLRYPCLWHRGTPNRSSSVRFMLGMIVTSSYRNLPPFSVTEAEQRLLGALALPFHCQPGATTPCGFVPNYFAPTLSGNLKELTWVYSPWGYRLLSRVFS